MLLTSELMVAEGRERAGRLGRRCPAHYFCTAAHIRPRPTAFSAVNTSSWRACAANLETSPWDRHKAVSAIARPLNSRFALALSRREMQCNGTGLIAVIAHDLDSRWIAALE